MTRALAILLFGCVQDPKDTTGTVDSPTTPAPVDADGDGATEADDCDDADPAVHPGATDWCGDGVDADCDGVDDCDGGITTDGAARYYTHPSETFSVGDGYNLFVTTGADGGPNLVVLTVGYTYSPSVALLTDLRPGLWTIPGTASATLIPQGFGGLDVGDVDGDGVEDLVAPYVELGADGACGIDVHRRTGDTWAAADFIPDETGAYCLVAVGTGDATGDGLADIAAATYVGSSAEPTEAVVILPGPLDEVRSVATDGWFLYDDGVENVNGASVHLDADLDGDGWSDLLVANGLDAVGARAQAWMLPGPVVDGDRITDAGFSMVGGTGFNTLLLGFLDIRLAQGSPDLDDDGYPEVIARGYSESADLGLWVFPGNTTGRHDFGDAPTSVRFDYNPTPVTTLPCSDHWSDTDAVADADFDGDGRLDLLFGMVDTEACVGTVRVIPGPIAGAMSGHDDATVVIGNPGGPGLSLGTSVAWYPDVDGDDRPEIVMGDPMYSAVWVMWSTLLP